jgi:hypothetical protein
MAIVFLKNRLNVFKGDQAIFGIERIVEHFTVYSYYCV